jgi:hypothetical protein
MVIVVAEGEGLAKAAGAHSIVSSATERTALARRVFETVIALSTA